MKIVLVVALMALAALAIWKKGIQRGLDLRGGSELLYRIRQDSVPEDERAGITERTVDVIRKRVDPTGQLEADIRARGKYRFYIQLPGMGPEKARQIEEMILRAGKLEFYFVNSDKKARNEALQGDPIVRNTHTAYFPAREQDKKSDDEREPKIKYYRPVEWDELADELKAEPSEADHWLLVQVEPQSMTGDDFDYIGPGTDAKGSPVVDFSFRGKARAEFAELTGSHNGERLAILLDGRIYSAPAIQSRIERRGQITGRFSRTERDDLITVLQSGRLPADIELERNNTVGAQLGEDSIRAGVRASVVALVLVLAFMLFYYLATGAVADFALVLNLLLVLGAMAGMGSYLTLPGIAGLVLTLGMAVDANVLINERIREERARGKTLGLAIRNGYERAFVTIIDSNLTTLITALILFGFGSGPVRGFALTLSFGIVISMFSAVWVTRLIVDLLVEKGWLRSLHMLQWLRKPNIAFSRVRHVTLAVSAVCIVLGLMVFVSRIESVLDTDFTGGVRAEMQLKEGVPIDEFRSTVKKLFDRSDVQSVWSAAPDQGLGEHPERFAIRVRELDKAQRMEKMKSDLRGMLEDTGLLQSLQPEPNWQFTVKLTEDRDETALRAMLAKRGYSESDIREVVLLDKASMEFSIVALRSTLSEENADAELAKILDALDPFLVSQTVPITSMRPVEERAADGMPRGPARDRKMELEIRTPCSPASVKEAVVRDILGGSRPRMLDVAGQDPEAPPEQQRKFIIRGAPETIAQILECNKKRLTIRSFRRPADEVLALSFSDPQKEDAIRDKLSESNLLDKLVRAVIPTGVKGREFAFFMNELSAGKGVEKVRDDLVSAFKGKLAIEKLDVTLTPVRAEAGAEAEEMDTLYKLTLPKAVTFQEIQARLVQAGYPNALLKPITTRKEALATTTEVTIKLPAQEPEAGAASALRGPPVKPGKDPAAVVIDAFANPDPFRSIEAIGSRVAGEMQNKATLAVFLSWVAIVFYIWFRFGEVKFGVAAVVALVHDVLFTLGLVGIADSLSGTALGELLGFSDIKINLTMIAAFLTLVGYSINDTIVVFDRIRENMGGVKRKVDAALVDTSVNQILSRTLLTSLTTFVTVMVLYIMGGAVIHGFAFVMTSGVIVGTYSSIFIASPILIGWESFVKLLRKVGRIVTFRFG